MSAVFTEWNKDVLDSYLIEITRDILAKKDEDGSPLVDKILDTAGQKGTGKWTVISSADLGIPITLMAEAVYGRCISSMKDLRVEAAKSFKPGNPKISGDRAVFVKDIMHALYASKIVSYAQGYMLMAAAGEQNKWNLNFGGIALMWRGGCIIRSAFLADIKAAFDKNKKLSNLLLAPFFKKAIKSSQRGWRKVVSTAVKKGIPVPAFSTALAFFDGFRTERLPANLLQAQRDYFGAHTYERIDKPRGEFFHTNWTGRGGAPAPPPLALQSLKLCQWTILSKPKEKLPPCSPEPCSASNSQTSTACWRTSLGRCANVSSASPTATG
jgi:6-phosphogluconate dehydrogenase